MMLQTAAFTNLRLVISLAFVGLLFTSCSREHGHVYFKPDSVDVASVRFSKSLYKFMQSDVVKKHTVRNDELPGMDINDSLPGNWRNRFPAAVIERELLVKFRLKNSSDSLQQFYFYPGAYFSHISLLELADSNLHLQEVSPDSTPDKWKMGFRLITLQPRSSATYFGRMNVLRTTATIFDPYVLHKDYIDGFIARRRQSREMTSIITYLAAGVMLMMIFYSIAAFRLNRSQEFFYYAGYAFCMALLLFLKSYLLYNFTAFNFFFESYWDFLVQCLGIICYLLFVRHFLNTKSRHPFLEKAFRISEWLISGLLTVYTLLYFLTDDFTWLDFFENFTKQIILIIGLIFVVYGWRKHERLINYLVWGNILLIMFSIISFLLIVSPLRMTSNPSFLFLNDALVYYETGIVLELILFLSGLAYKNRRDLIERTRERERLRMENERKEMEKQMAVLAAQQEERNRISADMHDELGSGVTAIRLMSEIVRSKMKEATLPEVDKISNSANDLITKMNTIIWTMSSSNDTLENLVTYIRAYALEFFENTSVECRFRMPETIPRIEMSGERRRNIFLAVKEALNNVLKHSKATLVQVDVKINDTLIILIADNGMGIDLENVRKFGNGLKNMQNRLHHINGSFNIKKEQGTVAIFEVSL